VLVPVFLLVHPPVSQMVEDFLMPRLPHEGSLNEVMLLIIAIVGTRVAPWQLFFQQSYVIDKRITPRFIQYERADLWIGIVFVTFGAVALMGVAAATFARHPEFVQFSDAGGVAFYLEKYAGEVPAVLSRCPSSTPASSVLQRSRCRPPTRSAMCWICATRCTASRQKQRHFMQCIAA
jgi:Mn2+/Fe2+ NRAMP family transporter